MAFSDIIPYTCVFLDCSWRDFYRTAVQCATARDSDRPSLLGRLESLWTTPADPRPALPAHAVRTAFDLYLRVMNFPPGSEVIVSAINIPDMIYVLHHHELKVVPVDISIETTAPRVEWVEGMVTERTVAIVVAHVYGKWFDVAPLLEIARRHGLPVVEDCAEGFSGFDRLGHPEADLSLFSFGVIKYCTAFGGAVAKIKNPELHRKMLALYRTYPVQSQSGYLFKLLKYSMVYIALNCPRFIKPGMYVTRSLNIDHKKYAVKMLRGFPDGLLEGIRHQPSAALLSTMLRRFSEFQASDFNLGNAKAEYVSQRLPENVVQVGTGAEVNNYWLFPIVVENPDEMVKVLNGLGVDAYRGATQLSIVEPDNGHKHLAHPLHSFVIRYPHEAKFLIDHVIYLPVNKTVPFQELDRVCRAVEVAVRSCSEASLLPLHGKSWDVRVKAKL